jgi:hypothetical protein
MASDGELLQAKLGKIEQGARGFQVLAVVLLVIGCVGVGGGALGLLHLAHRHFAWAATLAWALRLVFGALPYFLVSWLARRVADALTTIASLIREIQEIV